MVDLEPATLSDLDALVEAWVALATEQREHGSQLHPDANRGQMREEIGLAIMNDGVVVARAAERTQGADEDLVGFIMFGVKSGALQRDVIRGILWNAWVRPDRRGEGIGSQLFDAAEADLRARGVDSIVLNVMARNEAARRLYRRRGYEPHRVEMEKPVADESDTHTN